MNPREAGSSHLISHVDERGVLTLTLNRPEVHNAFGSDLIASLSAALHEAENDANVRAIVLTGAGKSFSAGADMNWMRAMAAASAEDNERDALQLAQLMRRLNFHAKPTIVRINGTAVGGGVGLVSCCDITVAVDTARFALTEVKLGLVPAVISPYVVRRLGEGASRRLFQSAETFDARRARELGLVQDVVAAEQLEDAVGACLTSLLAAGPRAVREAKKLVLQMMHLDRAQQRQIDQQNARLIARLRVSPEGQEGLTAFLDKRVPNWQGSPDG